MWVCGDKSPERGHGTLSVLLWRSHRCRVQQKQLRCAHFSHDHLQLVRPHRHRPYRPSFRIFRFLLDRRQLTSHFTSSVMGLLRPATPGFIVTLTAAILLAVVSFCVPWIKSVYFLKAGLAVEGISGNITFGTLGFCTEINGNTTCSSPRVGYQLGMSTPLALSYCSFTLCLSFI
jgi:hypothetical protein